MIFWGKILDKIFQKVPHRFLEKILASKNCLNIYLSNKKIKLVVPLQLSEQPTFEWTSVTLPDLYK